MIRALTELRVLACLRRIAKAMEEANRLELHRQELEHPPLANSSAPPRKLAVSHPKIDDWNKRAAGVPDDAA